MFDYQILQRGPKAQSVSYSSAMTLEYLTTAHKMLAAGV